MKIICIGLNYRKHAEEMGKPFPDEPMFFLKADSSIIKNNKPFFLPDFSDEIHYEAEIVLRICKLGKSVSAKFAHRYYDAVTLGIDITARDLQRRQSERGHPWEICKSFDGSAPLGRFLPVSELGNIHDLPFRLEKNGEVVQQSTTADLIFGIDAIIAWVSRFFTLKTGDLIFTGTPSGVGPLRKDDHLKGFIGDQPVIDFYIR
ncbi:MAG: fumarylacetoacetate hydrolase family protein [Bacteroidetes bacterium]|nr:fumarylacetoacetate hydrolase family protein [Bacteroidota bacterium]